MRQRGSSTKKTQTRKAPIWAAVVIVLGMTLMLGLTINYRAYTTMSGEIRENDQLSTQIQSLTDENLQLQDEIHNLKTDPKVIEREAKRLGMALAPKKVSVPGN